MSEEVKKILDYLKTENGNCSSELSYDETHLLLNYITNLQKENELLQRTNKFLFETSYEYKQRIDKAIEYMKERKKYSGDVFYLDEIQTEILYEILGGDE